MTRQEQIIYLLGQIKSNIEWLGYMASESKNNDLIDALSEFESKFNKEIKVIFD